MSSRPPSSWTLKPRGAQLIKKVYEADPLLCPRYWGAMRIIAVSDQPAVLETLLTQLGLWPVLAHGPSEASAA